MTENLTFSQRRLQENAEARVRGEVIENRPAIAPVPANRQRTAEIRCMEFNRVDCEIDDSAPL
jgi:hypothetical protein